MSTHTWELPEIPENATGFSVMRLLSDEHAQSYQTVQAPGGHTSARKVLATAHRLRAIEQFDTMRHRPYAIVELVDEDEGHVDGLVFTIPTQQAFLWWQANLSLVAAEPLWSEQNPAWAEDVRVDLPLTPTVATLVVGLLSHALMSGAPATPESCVDTLQVIDTLRRQIGYAYHDRNHRPEPEEDPTSPLDFLLHHYDGKHL